MKIHFIVAALISIILFGCLCPIVDNALPTADERSDCGGEGQDVCITGHSCNGLFESCDTGFLKSNGKCVKAANQPQQPSVPDKAKLGDFCGGIAGIRCIDGLECRVEADYHDGGGHCIKPPEPLSPINKKEAVNQTNSSSNIASTVNSSDFDCMLVKNVGSGEVSCYKCPLGSVPEKCIILGMYGRYSLPKGMIGIPYACYREDGECKLAQ